MNIPKVLIVEDELIIALDIKRILEKSDFSVTAIASNYNSALNNVRITRPDIILMDINLKNSKDGIEVTKKISETENIPVIYITAFADDETIKRAIETEPVGYLMKPFKEEDLKSNILLGLYKATKKEPQEVSGHFKIGLGYYFDTSKNILLYKELPIKLTKKEMSLLKILIEARGELVSFKSLEEQIWPSSNISPSTLRTLIYRLRSRFDHKLIETEAMIGCKLILEA